MALLRTGAEMPCSPVSCSSLLEFELGTAAIVLDRPATILEPVLSGGFYLSHVRIWSRSQNPSVPAGEVSSKEVNEGHPAVRVPVGGERSDHGLLVQNAHGSDHLLRWSALARVETVQNPVERRVVLLRDSRFTVVDVGDGLLNLLQLLQANPGLETLYEDAHAPRFREGVLPVLVHGTPHPSLVEVCLVELSRTGDPPLGEQVRSTQPHDVEAVAVRLPGLSALHCIVTHEEFCLQPKSLRACCLGEERLGSRLPRTDDKELHSHGAQVGFYAESHIVELALKFAEWTPGDLRSIQSNPSLRGVLGSDWGSAGPTTEFLRQNPV